LGLGVLRQRLELSLLDGNECSTSVEPTWERKSKADSNYHRLAALSSAGHRQTTNGQSRAPLHRQLRRFRMATRQSRWLGCQTFYQVHVGRSFMCYLPPSLQKQNNHDLHMQDVNTILCQILIQGFRHLPAHYH